MSDNIIRKVINVQQKKCRAQNQVLRNYSINWIFLRTPPTQNHLKPSITEKRRNNQISDLKFHRLKLVK